MNKMKKKTTEDSSKRPGGRQNGCQPAASTLADNRNTSVFQRQQIEGIDNSPLMTRQRQQIDHSFAQAIQRAAPEEEELMQGRFETTQRQSLEEDEELMQGRFETAQQQPMEDEELLQGRFSPNAATTQLQEEASQADNRTRMPKHLKAGVESLSGMDLSDVHVHYNSSKPAQVNALAYAQGNDIHLGAGQEQHLPHEAWHVVQQRQGRVQPTMQLEGMQINDDVGLEKEADVMGARALTAGEKK